MIIGIVAESRPSQVPFSVYDNAVIVMDFEAGIYRINGVDTPISDLLVTYGNISGGKLINNANNLGEISNKGTRTLVNAFPTAGFSFLLDYTVVEFYGTGGTLDAMAVSIGAQNTNEYAELGVASETFYEWTTVSDWWDRVGMNQYRDRDIRPIYTEGEGARTKIAVTRTLESCKSCLNGQTVMTNSSYVADYDILVDGIAFGNNFYYNSVDVYNYVHRFIVYPAMTDIDMQRVTSV